MEAEKPRLHSPSRNPRSLTSLAFAQDAEGLYRDAEAVEQMLVSRGWEAVQRLLGEFEKSEQAALFHVMASNQVAAAQSAGRIEGLQGAARAAQAIRAAAESKRSQLEAAEAAER